MIQDGDGEHPERTLIEELKALRRERAEYERLVKKVRENEDRAVRAMMRKAMGE